MTWHTATYSLRHLRSTSRPRVQFSTLLCLQLLHYRLRARREKQTIIRSPQHAALLPRSRSAPRSNE